MAKLQVDYTTEEVENILTRAAKAAVQELDGRARPLPKNISIVWHDDYGCSVIIEDKPFAIDQSSPFSDEDD